jgi:uncharacterized membrane protein YbhN (UPF0104 family)
MKLAINVVLSLVTLAICLWLVWPNGHDRHEIRLALSALRFSEFWPYLAGSIGLLAVTHFCRAYRWGHLLAPIGARVPSGQLLAISSIGFMAILALPARLGEFVRPALVRKPGVVSAAAALGTVAVERIVDGLLVSLFVFGACWARRGPDAPGWMMPTAYAALAVFLSALVFLLLAMRWPRQTVRGAVMMTLLPRLAPRIAAKLEDKLLMMISGLDVLKQPRHFLPFLAWTLVYWVANGFSVWVLALGFKLPLTMFGAFATMGLVAVGITLPNSPGLAGQYEYFTSLGLSLYLAGDVVKTTGMAFAIMLHVIQVVWYLGMGALGMVSSHISFADLRRARKLDEAETAGDNGALEDPPAA